MLPQINSWIHMHMFNQDRNRHYYKESFSTRGAFLSLQLPSKKASRKKRMWSTQDGSSLLRFASRMSPAAENRRSTAVEVAGGVKYLYKGLVGVIECAYVTFLPVQPRHCQQDLWPQVRVPFASTKTNIQHLAARREVHYPPAPPLCWC